jgi:UPF0755 protein
MTEPVCTISKPRLLRLLVLLVVLALAAAAWVFSQYQQFSDAPVTLPQDEMVFEIRPGMSLGQLAHELHAQGVIGHPRFFILLGRHMQTAHKLKAGEYTLTRDLTARSLLGLFSGGRVVQYTLTLIEGQTFAELRRRIEAHPMLVQTLQGLDDAEVMARLGHAGEHPEGRFLADTYHFPRNTTDLDFLQRAYNAMQQTLQAAWEVRDKDLPLANAYEALILASIVEKETGVAGERARIAGVFVRRLRRGMKLQTDPTVIYGMGEDFDGNIRRDDLSRDTPYNTYTRAGLPPTPIATPGRAAIEAVMHPGAGSALYFVASGGGRHYFSDTLKEHNLAVDKFQRGRKGISLPKESEVK